MQLFLVGYILIEIAEIFTVGLFPLEHKVQVVSKACIITLATQLTHLGVYWHTSWHDYCDHMDPNVERRCWLSIVGRRYSIISRLDGRFCSHTLHRHRLYCSRHGIQLDWVLSSQHHWQQPKYRPLRPISACTSSLLVRVLLLGNSAGYSSLRRAQTHDLAGFCCITLRHRPNIQLRGQCSYLPWYKWQDRRRLVRNIVHLARGGDDLGILVEYNRR